MHENLQVVYVHPPTESAPLDADTTFHVVKTPLETDAVNMGHTRNQQAVRVVDCTVAHLVLPSYVADYINVPCLACQ